MTTCFYIALTSLTNFKILITHTHFTNSLKEVKMILKIIITIIYKLYKIQFNVEVSHVISVEIT